MAVAEATASEALFMALFFLFFSGETENLLLVVAAIYSWEPLYNYSESVITL